MKHMKLRILSISLVVMLTFGAALSEGAPAPKLQMTSVLHNYGDVMKGERILHAFVIRNQGTADLIIEQANPD